MTSFLRSDRSRPVAVWLFVVAAFVLAMIVVLSVMNGLQEEMRTRILGMIPHATLTSSAPLRDWQQLAQQATQLQGALTEQRSQLAHKEQALESLQAAWTSGRGSFQEVIEGRRMLIEARLTRTRAVAEQYQAGRIFIAGDAAQLVFEDPAGMAAAAPRVDAFLERVSATEGVVQAPAGSAPPERLTLSDCAARMPLPAKTGRQRPGKI